MLRYAFVILLGLLSLCETAHATGAENCTTEFLKVDIDIVSDDASCDSNGTQALQEMISHIVNKRFTKYGEEAPEVVSSIEIDGVCQSPPSSDRRALQETGGFLYIGGGPCRLCWGGTLQAMYAAVSII